MTDPIPIAIRDLIASLMRSQMLIENSYQYDMGSINEYDVANVDDWPRTLIIPDYETAHDHEPGRDQSLYENTLRFKIIGEWKNESSPVPGDYDPILECEKLVEDYKRFFGNYYQLADAGAFVILYAGHKKIFSNDNTYPVKVEFYVDVEYNQDRLNPSQSG